jgi:HK97 family phage prohead protease
MKLKHKAVDGLKVEVKDADQGTVRAVFSTFNVIDHDGDVTLPGAFQKGQKVRISAYNHTSWSGALPVGKGVIDADDTEAWVDAQFFLNTTAGRETFEVVKQMEELQEWSYGFDVLEAAQGQQEGEDVQFLQKLDVHEVSPVLLGAGIDTRTLAVKGAKQFQSDLYSALSEAGTERFGGTDTYVYVDDFELDESYVVYAVCSPTAIDLRRVSYTRSDDDVTLGDQVIEVERVTSYEPKALHERNLKLSDHIDAVKDEVDAVTERLEAVKAARAGKGKSLGEESRAGAESLAAELESSLKSLREVLASAVAPSGVSLDADVALARELSRDRL